MEATTNDFDFLISSLKEYISLTEKETETIRMLFEKEDFKKNELILKEGDYCQKLYFIARGIIRFSLFVDGEDRTFVFRAEGTFCTDLESFFKRAPSRYNITAIEPTTIYSINHENLNKFYNDISYGDRFGRLAIEKIFIMVVNHLTNFYSETPEERYLRFVSLHRGLLQRIPQYHIASYIGVSPQTLCRIKKRVL